MCSMKRTGHLLPVMNRSIPSAHNKPKHPVPMAETLFVTVTVNSDRQLKRLIVPIDANSQPTTVDATGFEKGSVEGGANVIIDPRDPAGNLRLIIKPDTTSGNLPSTTTVNGTVDLDRGEGVVANDVVFTIITNPAGAVSLTLEDGGDEAVDTEVVVTP